VRIGSIAGMDVRLDWSVIVIFWLLTWSLAASGLPALASGFPTALYWVAALTTTFAFFVSLLAHEMSHCIEARRQGLPVRDITLWLLGGVSTIEREPETASGDLRIAISGPAVSLALGLVSLGIAAAFAALGASDLLVACAVWLGSVNLLLAVFNILPAAPLDGGRVLRAIRWRQTGDRERASLDAARAGRVLGFVLVGLGFLELLVGADISGLWLVLLGWFLLSAARAEEVQVRYTHDLAATRIRDVMTPDPITVTPGTTVYDVLHDYVLTRHCSSFPMVDVHGRLAGLVTLSRMRRVPATARATTPVSAVAWNADEVTVADPDDLLLDVLRRARPGGDGRVVVCRADAVVGIVSPADVTRELQLIDIERERRSAA
jgi:Zn-dependent protease/CBS domain-containing protein